MSHVPTSRLHAFVGQAIRVVSSPVAGLTASGTNTPVLRIDGMANIDGAKEDTDDGLVIEAAFNIPVDTAPDVYRWQLWVADSDNGNPRPVAVGDLRVDAKVPA